MEDIKNSKRVIEKTISYIFTFVGIFSAGFILGNVGKSGLLASGFLTLCSLTIFGLEETKHGTN